MTKRVIVEWTYTDDYGRYDTTGKRELFDEMTEAKEWAETMKRVNGGYFHLFRIYEIDYEKYLEVEALKREIAKLYEKIDEINYEIEVK